MKTNNKFKKRCPYCNRIIKSGGASGEGFEEIFKRHLRVHKLKKSEGEE